MSLLKRLLEINYKLKTKDAEFYRKLGVDIQGDDVHILNSDLDENYPYLLSIGNHVTITHSTVLTHDATTIRFSGFTKVGKVSIGNNVFVGYNSLIMPGSDIGDNVIIGAGTIVRGKVESNSVVAGNPMRYICSYDQYEKKHLNRIKDFSFLAGTDMKDREKMCNLLNSEKYVYSK